MNLIEECVHLKNEDEKVDILGGDKMWIFCCWSGFFVFSTVELSSLVLCGATQTLVPAKP